MSSTLLKRSLRFNAAFSALCAFDLLFFSESIAQLMGSFDPHYLFLLGIALLLFTLLTLYVSESRPINLAHARLISYLDIAWVLGTFALLIVASTHLSLIGVAIITATSAIVAACAYYQLQGIKQASTPLAEVIQS